MFHVVNEKHDLFEISLKCFFFCFANFKILYKITRSLWKIFKIMYKKISS